MSDQGNTFNVIDSGADYTGVSDSAAAINSAIAAATTAGGGTVLFPPGTYLVHSVSLNLVSNVVFYGYGATILGKTGTSAVLSFTNTTEGGTGIVNSMILGFVIDTTNMSGGALQIKSQNNSDIAIRDVRIKSSSSAASPAIMIGYLDPSSFSNNHSARMLIDHCTLYGGTFPSTTALQLISCDESSVVNCKFYSINTTALFPVQVGGYCNGVAFIGNTFHACTSSLIVTQASYVVVAGNTFRTASGVQEINLVNCQNVQVVGNSFAGQVNAMAIQLHDIAASSYGNSANIIIGTNVFTNYEFGIYVEPAGGSVSASQTNLVVSNNLFSNVSTSTSIPGTVGSIVHDNP
jgi:hypothetical protein